MQTRKKDTAVSVRTSKEVSTEQTLSSEKVELIKKTVAKGATNDELQLFLLISKKSGLDPFSKQIHFIKRRVWNRAKKAYDEVGSIQTGIDGYRAIAGRTGELAGIDDAEYNEEGPLNPQKATVTVYRIVKGVRVPFTASARWSEYAPIYENKLSPTWEKMPYLMLGKCAEALALRKAFPNDLSGIYTHEEMAQADADKEPIVEVKEVKTIDEDLEIKSEITKSLKVLLPSVDKDTIHERVKALTGLELVPENYEEIASRLELLVDEQSKQDKDNG